MGPKPLFKAKVQLNVQDPKYAVRVSTSSSRPMKIAVNPTTLEKLSSQTGAASAILYSSFPCAFSRSYSCVRLCLNSSSLSTPVKITISMGKLSGRK